MIWPGPQHIKKVTRNKQHANEYLTRLDKEIEMQGEFSIEIDPRRVDEESIGNLADCRFITTLTCQMCSARNA